MKIQMIKKTFKELKELDAVIGNLYGKNPELKKGKFGYAYNKFVKKNFVPMLNEYRDELNLIAVNNALTDEKTKELIYDETNSRGFKFSKEGLIACMKQEKECEANWNTKELDLEPFISVEVPENMTEEEIEVLTGVII